MGFRKGVRYNEPNGYGYTLLGDFRCSGGESTIFSCMNIAPNNTCSHKQDQGVACWDKVNHEKQLDESKQDEVKLTYLKSKGSCQIEE